MFNWWIGPIIGLILIGCGKDKDDGGHDAGSNNDGANADVDTGSTPVAVPVQLAAFDDSWHESWQGSPAVADLDGDGAMEIVVARSGRLLAWHLDGSVLFSVDTTGGRIWSSPVVADLVPDNAGLEVAVASRGSVYIYDSAGNVLPRFPVEWQDELRAIAAGDLDGDGDLELVVVTTSPLSGNDQRDIVMAYHHDGTVMDGYPPNTQGTAGCDDACYVTGGYDQTLAVGDVNADGSADIFAPQDNAYISLHHGSGLAFDANVMFDSRTKFSGIRFLHDLALAQQGWADDESSANQGHFTNSSPAIADVNGDGTNELIVLGSVQNAAQSDRERGVALWILNNDGTRLAGWEEPFHAPNYLAGLWDYDSTNVVAANNEVAVADVLAADAGPEFVFAGFDGAIHCVNMNREEVWYHTYTTSNRVLTGGVLVADLSADGVPEIIFNTYTPDADRPGHLVILNAGGTELHRIELPARGAMPVPTVADIDGDGTLEIVVSLKDAVDGIGQMLVYNFPGSDTAMLPWPTGRANYSRNGTVTL